MKIKATDKQIVKIATLAINASSPVGLGILHFQNKSYTEDEVLRDIKKSWNAIFKQVNLDYYHGRMVKLRITYLPNEDVWECQEKFHPDWQSFAIRYPTIYDLLADVPEIKIIKED